MACPRRSSTTATPASDRSPPSAAAPATSLDVDYSALGQAQQLVLGTANTADTATGLTHVDARQYDPELGQFISVDPLLQTGVGQTLNGYSSAVQNPPTIAPVVAEAVPLWSRE
ncbi:RHS repeat-associated core domain-containing protein [Streptomyces sp. NPDC057438]|uniref:RHS repeat-associated core domain-containing protein n=1 Tax=Streptomyces sp. NPDC057438 TaxID=3346133 RepID=UPI0036C9C234